MKPIKDQQYPWRIDLQQASLTEYSKILEARRLELLTVLNTDDFNGQLISYDLFSIEFIRLFCSHVFGCCLDELMAEWISLMEQRDRILRLTIAEVLGYIRISMSFILFIRVVHTSIYFQVNQAEMIRRFVRLFEAMKDTLSLPDLSSAPISLHSSLIHSWQEVRRYLAKQQVDVDHIDTVNNVGMAQLR